MRYKYAVQWYSDLNIAQDHRNIFMLLKLIEPTINIFTLENVTINSLDDFPSEASQYTFIFNDVKKCPKTSRAYITFKIESSRSILDLKQNNYSSMQKRFATH